LRIYVTNTGLAAERACGRAVKLLTQVPNTPHLEYETQACIIHVMNSRRRRASVELITLVDKVSQDNPSLGR
jgi:hypothetical protein